MRGAKPAIIGLRLPTIIGRGREAKLRVARARVSRRHCRLFEQDGEFLAEDLESSNGTYLNGQRITGQSAIAPLDELVVGNVSFQILCLRHEVVQDPEPAFALSDPGRVVAEPSSAIEYTETVAGSFVGILDADIGQRDQPAIGPNPWIVNDDKPAGQDISGEESAFQSFLDGLSEDGPQ